jgi:hypothetical protein
MFACCQNYTCRINIESEMLTCYSQQKKKKPWKCSQFLTTSSSVSIYLEHIAYYSFPVATKKL